MIEIQTQVSRLFAYGSKGDLMHCNAIVTIISSYDPRRESMLAYASPSNRIAIVITGLVR